jgi:uncharacterized protein YdeI (YjbR/CyaY-like superfamily)
MQRLNRREQVSFSVSPPDCQLRNRSSKKAMDITETLYVANRDDWREWLAEHYSSSTEIWLVYYRRQTGEPRIPYNDAVEEALCFGWIDSITKNLDQERYAQRFTPRKQKSKFSQTNKERLKRLIKKGKVLPEVLANLGDIGLEDFEYPTGIMAAIRENEQAWENFQRYSGSYQRIRIAYVDGARNRPGEYEKRLEHLIRMTEQDKQFGFGIEDYY